jgi:hypothetical protein
VIVRSGVLLAVTGLLLIGGCRDTTNVATTRPQGSLWVPDSAAVLAHEEYSGMSSETRTVVADSATWVATWSQIYAPYGSKPARPDVDFATHRVLVVALGWRGTGGYRIGIDSLVTVPMRTFAYVTAVAPGRGCITTQLVTQPVQLVRVPQSLEPFAFEYREVVHDCQ